MIVRDNAEFRPAVNNSKQTEMTVRRRLPARSFGQREPIQYLVLQQQILSLGARSEYRRTCGLYPTLELLPLSSNHQFVQICDRLGVLANLLLRRWVEDGEPGIDVPFVRVDAQGNIDLDILDTAYPPSMLPGELIVGLPGGSHAQESSMSDSLRICGDTVVHLTGEIDMFGAERGEDRLNEFEAFVRGSVLDEDLDHCVTNACPR